MEEKLSGGGAGSCDGAVGSGCFFMVVVVIVIEMVVVVVAVL